MSLNITSIRTTAKARSFKVTTACALVAMTLGITPALAQDQGSMTVGNTTVSVGAGTAILTLPDVEFLALTPQLTTNSIAKIKTSNDFGDEIGFNVNGSIEFPATGLGGGSTMIGISGFYSHIEDDDTLRCTTTASIDCKITNIVDDPNQADSIFTNGIGFSQIVTSDREVDHWGVSVEARRQLTPDVMGVTRAPHKRNVSLGLDWRSLNQDLSVVSAIEATTIRVNYAEQLDTDYYGVYASWGGDYSPFLFKGLWNKWGLESSFRVRGGIYHAETDYNGNFSQTGGIVTPIPLTGLSLSNDEIAFIGGLSLETRKKISRRATLSLKSEYEYYSYVPDMRYNDQDVRGGGAIVFSGLNVGTSIGSDDAFSARTTLRLTIKLGPDSVFEEPLK